MCGISLSIGESFSKQSLLLMQHRGPDASGFKKFSIHNKPIELGQFRLAIIDLLDRATQPISWNNERYWLVFNGEIYNYLELKSELETLGCDFKTTSDSEVLLAALATWGEAVLPRLVGMFAFVMLDSLKGEILLARDPFGIKPLFFIQTDKGMAFASEIPPLLEYPGVTRVANMQRVHDYITFGQTDNDSQTMFRDISSFPPAHVAKIDLNNSKVELKSEKYWSPEIKNKSSLSFDSASKQIRDLFLENVSLHMRSDVPVGVTLSGGIDSSAILACMRAVGGESLKISSFSFISPGSELDEEKWIDISAKTAGATSHKVEIEPKDILEDIDRLIQIQGEPFGSTSIYAQHKVMELVQKKGIKVLLDGQGADEIFGGYRPFLAARLSDILSKGNFVEATRFLYNISKLPGSSLKKLSLQALGEFLPEGARSSVRKLFGLSPEPEWINKEWLSHRNVHLIHPFRKHTGSGFVYDRLQDSLSKTVLPSLLRFQDRNSMCFSIEARVPFLTTKLVEAAYSYPSEYLISNEGVTKSVFRSSMRGIVPDAILDRRDKIGFATPEKNWLTILHPWIEETFNKFDFNYDDPQKLDH